MGGGGTPGMWVGRTALPLNYAWTPLMNVYQHFLKKFGCVYQIKIGMVGINQRATQSAGAAGGCYWVIFFTKKANSLFSFFYKKRVVLYNTGNWLKSIQVSELGKF